MSAAHDDRWQHLCTISELIAEARQDSGGLAEVALLLESVLEVFPSSLDPVSDFEGFSVRQFTKALHSAVAECADSSARKPAVDVR